MASASGGKPGKEKNYCRFCLKYIVPSSVGKYATPHAELFATLKNKEFTSPLELNQVVLSDIVNLLSKDFGKYKISKDDNLSQFCCMPCGQSLVRSAGTLKKLFKNLHKLPPGYESPSPALKRKPFGSPGSPSTKVLAKKTKVC